ncbi:MAG: double-strand break repair helicase AddA, partial [Pseudomonadota bacterium]
ELLRSEVVDDLADGPQAQKVRNMLAFFTGDDLSQLTAEIATKRDHFQTPTNDADLKAALNLPPTAQRDDALKIAFLGHESDIIVELAEAFADQSATYKKFAGHLGELDVQNPTWDSFNTLCSLFLYKGTGQSKSSNFPQSNHIKAVAAMAPIAPQLHDWMDRVAQAQQFLWAMDAFDRTRAMYDFADAFLPAYEARKLAMGALDFDDLIGKAKALLEDPAVAQWVLFRLDGGIDHILVDEAQDTSPTQWAVIKQLAQEFAAGQGARSDQDRTIFVVGDKKQSIYSFQGADPAAFDEMKDHFRDAHHAINKPFTTTSLDYSFRSAQTILSVVDATFTGDLTAGMDDHLSHIAFKENMPGRVDLWPVIEKSSTEDDRPWYTPVDQPSATDHTILMARRVAEQIRHIIASETIPAEIENTGQYNARPITEGDFLILVQRRSDLFAEIIRACKNAGLQIAGADRLRVGAELAVKDIAALLSFLALPEDDLSLAAALRSPLFGWTEQELFTLAHHRPDKSYLWTALRDADHPDTLAILNDLRRQADFLRPYDLIERILIRHDGRRKLLARLGAEAEDGIDALLSQALAYESTGVPSLTGFLTWMETDDLEVKRQMDNQGDRIRVMTVHGAKGLEAPIVILPDTAKREIRVNAELLQSGDHLIWKTPTKESAPIVTGLRNDVIAAQARERARLLYVAMTRAEKWLIVGAAGDVGQDNESWYNIIAAGMAQRGEFQAQSGDLDIKRVADLNWDGLDRTTSDTPKPKHIEIPELAPLPSVSRATTIAPSDLPGPKALPGAIDLDTTEAAMARGTIIHRLLEHLPAATPADRRAVALQLTEDNHLIDHTLSLIDHPELHHLWSETTLAEVSITADIPELGRIHGTIDRLIVTPDRIIAVDYKSNRHVPATPQKTPGGIINQLAVYDAALAQIYPDHSIETAILWTETAHLTTIPRNQLHEALNRLTSS